MYEKKVIAEESNFKEALALAFVLYFNFNLKFPQRVSLTFDFIQRFFFKIYPDAGSKISKGKDKQNLKNKVITLIKKMRDV